MSRLRWAALGGVLVVAAGAFVWFIWPTPWEYRTELWESPFRPYTRNIPVRIRINRLTGEKQNQGGPEGVWGHYVW
jgi:hypothetical protein